MLKEILLEENDYCDIICRIYCKAIATVISIMIFFTL